MIIVATSNFPMQQDQSIFEGQNGAQIRVDGQHVLTPTVGKLGVGIEFIDPSDVERIKHLNNEQNSVAGYELNLMDGTYFTEVLGPLNEDAQKYQILIEQSLEKARELYEGNAIPFERLEGLGNSMEHLDSVFAESHIDTKQDTIHSICGPDVGHPYAKNTIFRTVIAVRVDSQIINLFFEKFLVNYSYLDSGVRKSTVTPIHAHPPNFEVAYFGQYGPESKAIEQEFTPFYKGEPLVSEDGSINKTALEAPDLFSELTLIPGPSRTINPGNRPMTFPDQIFDSATMNDKESFFKFSGIFRPHQVTIIDDSDIRTVFHSLIAYLSPDGVVNVFTPEGRVAKKYSHDEWNK